MKKNIYKILLGVCSLFSLIALFLPLLAVREENKYDITTYSIRNAFGSFTMKDIKTVLVYGGSIVIKVSLILLIILQLLAALSLSWKRIKSMYALYIAAALANIVSGLSIWLVAEENAKRWGWLIIKPGTGTYVLLAISIIEFVLLLCCATVRE